MTSEFKLDGDVNLVWFNIVDYEVVHAISKLILDYKIGEEEGKVKSLKYARCIEARFPFT